MHASICMHNRDTKKKKKKKKKKNRAQISTNAALRMSNLNLYAFKGVKLSMLEFEASYVPFKILFKNFASDMTIYNTPS